ncbi:hypothetical protein F3Y22_tig00116996pilonHSYRG00114 [Hibiscus syriacus]|uniref:Uncharacterized protein n=1 Tax=Hibiscus syriacus TaxID=106335 RepID=A0A6A2WGY7_HIBSY|nr:hypothetical protein F3Y22_tig00116996pilonHSYRG00114 [Hibiscus syriacus]
MLNESSFEAQEVVLQLRPPTFHHSQPPWLLSHTPTPNAGLRAPYDRFALKSPFFSPSLHLLLPSRLPTNTVSTATRFSKRVASKQAYIYRDCRYIYNERTPFEKVPDSYCPGKFPVELKPFMWCSKEEIQAISDKDVRKARKEQLKRDEAVG